MSETDPGSDIPPYRYTAALAGEIEAALAGPLGAARAPSTRPTRPVRWPTRSIPACRRDEALRARHVPVPVRARACTSGTRWATSAPTCYARYLRMTGHNVLHTMGFDAFGLPAEQYAVQTGQHPRDDHRGQHRACTARQLRRLGLAHDQRRIVATTDVGVLPVDAVDLPADLQLLVRRGRRHGPGRSPSWSPSSTPGSRRRPGRPARGPSCPPSSGVRSSTTTGWPTVGEAPVNWCPGLGTVLANEEVTADGRSERGNFPVFQRSLRQWMMRITAYADRLLDDLDRLDWPESVKLMQRNWIGRSTGAHVDFADRPPARSRSSPPGRTPCSARPTWCWRPSTRWSTR